MYNPQYNYKHIEFLGTRIAHFELLHIFSLHNGHRVCGTG